MDSARRDSAIGWRCIVFKGLYVVMCASKSGAGQCYDGCSSEGTSENWAGECVKGEAARAGHAMGARRWML